MAFTIISANNTASTTTISDDAVIEAVLSSATAVSVSGDATVVANGSIIGFAASGNAVGVASSFNLNLINNGTITGSTAILLNGGLNVPFLDVAQQTIINHGVIRADGSDKAAIEDGATGATAFMVQHIFNDGQIIGEFGLKLGGKNSLVENGGLIRGTAFRAMILGDDSDVVRNWGQVDGSIELGAGTNRIENSGAITGNLLGLTGADTLVNSGDIVGSINFGGGNNGFGGNNNNMGKGNGFNGNSNNNNNFGGNGGGSNGASSDNLGVHFDFFRINLYRVI